MMMTDNTAGTKVVNGWKLYAHQSYEETWDALLKEAKGLE